MVPIKPMLDDVELQQVQKIEVDEDQVLIQHSIPALEGDFLQRLNRRATQVTLTGVLTGPEVGEGLKTLREKFRAAEPVPFVADITTATQVDQVLIEEMGVRELAGKPERFEYALTLREFIVPPEAITEEPPEPDVPEPPDDDIDQNVGTLIVEVIVEGQPNFDFSRVTVTVQGTTQDGEDLSRTLTTREGNIWTEEGIPASRGEYTVAAVVTGPPAMSGSARTVVRAGQKAGVKIILRTGANIATAFIVHFWFDNAFIEPCMRSVMREVAAYAQSHPGEKLLIVGHTDKVGPPNYNQPLSERRARSAYAYLTYGRDPEAAAVEWDQLRRKRTTRRSINDTWGAREYQYILQDLGYYPHSITEEHDDETDAAVRRFQEDKGLAVDGKVGDHTWLALINAYLGQDSLAIPESQFLPNARDGCDGGILKWLGCGEEDPVDTRGTAWRPNRRTEFLFVKDDTLPCKVPEPKTFDLPPPDGAGPTWCLDGGGNGRCCFVTPAKENVCPQEGEKWCRQPVDPRKIRVSGSVKFEDGTPLANTEYILIAPDGKYLHKDAKGKPDLGEVPSGEKRGRPNPIHNRTDDEGLFSFPKETPVGVYVLELVGRFVARLEGEPPEAAKGNVVCKRLDGSSDFDVIVAQVATTFHLQVSGATQIGGSAGTDYLATQSASGNVIVTAVSPPGTVAAPRSIVWTGGEEVPGNLLQRRVTRTTIGQMTVTATMPASGVTKSVDIFVVRVTLDVDADRDGVVEDEAEGRDRWEFGPGKKGAVILVNNDDDNNSNDLDLEDIAIDGATDVDDLTPLVIRQTGPLPAGVSIVLSVADQSKIRIFDQRSSSGAAIVGPSPLSSKSTVTGTDVADLELGLEGTQYPDSGFDGLIDLKLSLMEGATELASDNVKVRVAPWVLPSHLNVTEELYIVEISGSNDAFVSEIEAIATSAGVPLVKAHVSDQWIQDCMEIGYSHIPIKQFSVALNAVNNDRPLFDFAPDNLLGPDYGLHQPPPNLSFSTFDSHGNIEVSPPVTVDSKVFKFGRIYYGGVARSSDTFNSDVQGFLKAQLVQKPFSIDTTWLGVGHVDEIVSFIPCDVGREFRMLFASVDEALRILRDLQNAGHGSLTLFTGKHPPPSEAHFGERSIDSILSDAALIATNANAQTRLNDIKNEFRTELGLDTANDIIEIPSLFITEPLFPGPVSALIPGMVNLLVITRPNFPDTQLVFPKPFGPVLGGVDQLEKDVRDKITPLGYAPSQLHFVDDFELYHILLGEVHCGTNSKRQPHSTPWYEQEDF